METSGGATRARVDGCEGCEEGQPPFVYLEDGHHYCIRCARKLLIVDKIHPAGRRDDDLTYEDVLFTDLPYEPDSEDGGTPEA